MLSLQSRHIVSPYVWVDDPIFSQTQNIGHPSVLSESEVATILIRNTLLFKEKTLEDRDYLRYAQRASSFGIKFSEIGVRIP